MQDQQSGKASSSGWADLAGRPADQASLCALAAADPGSLTGAQLVDAVVASEKALSLLTGLQLRLLAALAVPFVAGDPMKLATRLARKNRVDDPTDDHVQHLVPDAAVSLAAAEIAAALRISPVTAGIRVRDANTMTSTLTPTLHALEDGRLDRGKVRVIAEHCEPLTAEHATQVQDLVLPHAEEVTTSELRDLTGQAVIVVDPDGAETRHQAAAARRELSLRALPDAMATLTAFLPADGAVKIFQISDLMATSTAGTPNDPRGIGARRVDALVDIADHLLTHGYLDLGDYLGPTATNTTNTTDTGTDTTDEGAPAAPTAPTTTDSATATDTTDEGAPAATTTPAATATPVTPADTDHPADSTTAAAPHPATGPDNVIDPGTTGTDRNNDNDNDTDTDTDTTAPPVDIAPPHGTGDPAAADIAAPTNIAPRTGTGQAPRPVAGPTPTGKLPGTSTPPNPRREPDRAGRSLTRQGRRPHLSVTIALGTLAGLDNLPGTLAGYGAIPAGLARSIAASAATITTHLTDPDTGAITHAGSLTYRPRQDLRDQIAALLTTCQFPSCRQPVWRCDIDHREPFDHHHPHHGGPTTPANTGPLCKRHHLFKHHTQWRLRPDPDQHVLHWTSPTGHHYQKRGTQAVPPDLWITSTSTAVAERLDIIATLTTNPETADRKTPTATSSIEELLTTLLLRTSINQRPRHYHHDTTAWHTTANPTTTGQDHDDDPPPPF